MPAFNENRRNVLRTEVAVNRFVAGLVQIGSGWTTLRIGCDCFLSGDSAYPMMQADDEDHPPLSKRSFESLGKRYVGR
jgi:hypothetical protein